MARDKVSGETAEAVDAMLREAMARIERGGLKAIIIKAVTIDGEELEHTFSLETEEERDATLLALKIVLRDVH